jgi:mono/diheme cytochrome c family protein
MDMMQRIFLLSLTIGLLLLSCGNNDGTSASAAMPKSNGEMLYDTHCTLCHGGDGKLKMGDAKDLSISTLTREEMIAVVANGRGTMMPYKQVLSAEEIEQVVDHVRSLKVKE